MVLKQGECVLDRMGDLLVWFLEKIMGTVLDFQEEVLFLWQEVTMDLP